MSEVFEKLINILSSIVVQGNENILLENDSLNEILILAKKQGLFEVVCCMLKGTNELAQYKNIAVMNIARNIQRNTYWQYHLECYENKSDICYIKGVTLARFYPVPDARVSGDTDILIKECDIKGISNYFTKQKCMVETLKNGMHHFEIHHGTSGMLEVHVSLCRDFLNTTLFKNMLTYNEPLIDISIENKIYKTLGINDGVNFITAHLIKHFLQEGIIFRQVLDLLLYMSYYVKEIDWDKYYKLWGDLGFLPFIKAIQGIGNKYFMFDFRNCEFNKLSEKILTEIENGGMLQMDKSERKIFVDTYLKLHNNLSKNDYIHLTKMNQYSLKERLFPDIVSMQKRGYRYLKEKPYLIWVAWLHRLFTIVVGKRKKKTTIVDSDVPATVQNRLNLFDDLKMI